MKAKYDTHGWGCDYWDRHAIKTIAATQGWQFVARCLVDWMRQEVADYDAKLGYELTEDERDTMRRAAEAIDVVLDD